MTLANELPNAQTSRQNSGIRSGQILIYVVLVAGCILTLMPFIWTILASFKTHAEIIDPTQQVFLPRQFTFANYETIFNDETMPLLRFYANSLFIALSNVVLHTFTSSLF